MKRSWRGWPQIDSRTKHTEVPLSGAAVLSRLDEALAALDTIPPWDAINTYFVSWAAREVGAESSGYRGWGEMSFSAG